MADPNETNDPNLESGNAGQINVARELNAVLEQVSARLEKIQQLTRSQADFVNSMVESFSNMQEYMQGMTERSTQMSEALDQAANAAMEKFSEENLSRVGNTLETVADNYEEASNKQKDSLLKMSEGVADMGNKTQAINKSMQGATKAINGNLTGSVEALGGFYKHSKNIHNETAALTEEMAELKENIKDATGGYKRLLQKGAGIGMSLVKNILSMVGSLIGAAAKFVKFSLTVPFTITKAAVNIGNTIRRDLVEVIQTAQEALKEKFDMDSDIGRGIQAMTNRGKGMLLAFQNPSSELVKLFGFGASGIASMIGFMGENIAAMGHYSEIFGRSLTKNQTRLKNFTRMVKGMGLSSEDVAYLALDSATNMKHINVRMAEMGVTLESVSKEFTVDRKRLSKNFMIMRRDITQFGHLSDEEIARTTARLTQMRVKLEDASAVFKKFSTFQDAANSVAMLSQTFGMNLDAMDMIQAKNPEEIINMFRESMLETGRSFSDLNRFEKDLMAQHTGMSAESLSALMNYRDLGLTHQEAVRRMESQKPTAKQQAALKKLNSAIKEVQKIMSFDSPFQAFFKGLSNNVALSKDLRNTLTSLSDGYQGIYEYALKLDPTTWSGLIKPIKLIVDIMSNILRSDAFKDGLVNAVTAIAEFTGRLFGATKGDVILSRLESNISIQMGKGGQLATKSARRKFKKQLLDEVEKMHKNNMLPIISLEKLKKYKDPREMIRYLNRIKQSIDPKDFAALQNFDVLMQNIATSIRDKYKKQKKPVPDNIKKELKSLDVKDDLSVGLSEGIGGVGKDNMGNVKKLLNLSGGIAGAIIKGGAIAFTAFLKLMNGGMDALKKAEEDGEFEGTNMIDSFLQFQPGELEKIGNSVGSAISDFIFNWDNIKNTTSLMGWLVSGIKDAFMLVIGVLGDVLKGGINEMFGKELFKPSKTNLMSRATVSSLKSKDASFAKGSLENVQQAFKDRENFAEGDNVQEEDLANLIAALSKKSGTVVDNNKRSDLAKKVKGYRNTFISSDTSDNKTRIDLARNIMKDLMSISDGVYTGNVSDMADSNTTLLERPITKIDAKTGRRTVEHFMQPQWIKDAQWLDEFIKKGSFFRNIIGKSYEPIMSNYGKTAGLESFTRDLPFLTYWTMYHKDIKKELIKNKPNKNDLFPHFKKKNAKLPEFAKHDFFKNFLFQIRRDAESDSGYQEMKAQEDILKMPAKMTTVNAKGSKPKVQQVQDFMSDAFDKLLNGMPFMNSGLTFVDNILSGIKGPNILESNMITPIPMTTSTSSAEGKFNESNNIDVKRERKILKKEIVEKTQQIIDKKKNAESPLELSGDIIFKPEFMSEMANFFVKDLELLKRMSYAWLGQGGKILDLAVCKDTTLNNGTSMFDAASENYNKKTG